MKEWFLLTVWSLNGPRTKFKSNFVIVILKIVEVFGFFNKLTCSIAVRCYRRNCGLAGSNRWQANSQPQCIGGFKIKEAGNGAIIQPFGGQLFLYLFLEVGAEHPTGLIKKFDHQRLGCVIDRRNIQNFDQFFGGPGECWGHGRTDLHPTGTSFRKRC